MSGGVTTVPHMSEKTTSSVICFANATFPKGEGLKGGKRKSHNPLRPLISWR